MTVPEILTGPILSALSPTATATAVVTLILRGHLIPRSWVKLLLADKDARIAYQDTAMTAKDNTIGELVKQNAEMTVSGRLSVALLQQIQPPVASHASTAGPGSGHVAATPPQT